MTLKEQIELLGQFTEGTEIGDAVEALLHGAHILNGISCTHEAKLALLAAEHVISNYIDSIYDFKYYDEVDPEVYQHITGSEKVTLKEWTDEG